MSVCDLALVKQGCAATVRPATTTTGTDGFGSVAHAFADGLESVMKTLMSFWTKVPSPDLVGGTSVVHTLDALTRPLVAFAAILGLLAGGARLAVTARHEQTGKAILRGLVLMALVTAAGATAVATLVHISDAFANHVLAKGLDGKPVDGRLVELGALPNVGSGLLFLLAFLGMLSALVQVGLMIVRGAVLAVLVGVLPVAAAASVTGTGYTWFRKLCGWILCFAVYRFLVAVIYASAFTMMGNGRDLPGVVGGFALIVLAIFTLPALLRLIPPAAEVVGGMGGSVLGGFSASAATGAVSVSGRGGWSHAAAPVNAPGLLGSSEPAGFGQGGPTAATGAGTHPGGDWNARSAASPSGSDVVAAGPGARGAVADAWALAGARAGGSSMPPAEWPPGETPTSGVTAGAVPVVVSPYEAARSNGHWKDGAV